MKPIIGILPLFDEKKESYWMLPGYMKGIANAGGIPVMLPFIENIEDIKQLSENFDGFLFTGGPDIDPAYYHEEKKENCGDLTPYRDTLESQLFKEVYALNKPILGICRGHQLLNVLCGGTLYQDLPAQYPSEINHRSPDAFMILQHNVRCLRTGKLYSVTGKESLKVSSIHHQAVKKLACGFKASAFADDGVIESIESDSEHIWGVQFHPELQAVEGDEAMKKLFVYFISQARTLSC